MKRTVIFFVLLMASVSVFGQRRGQVIKWFSIAAKGGVGNSILINSDVFNQQGAEPNVFSISYAYGGRFTFTYGDNIGFGAEALWGGFSQEYALATGTDSYDKTLDFTSLDYTFFFRYTGNNGGYFEIGPSFTNLETVDESNSIQGSFLPRTDLMNTYENKYTNLMIGFGLAAVRTERLDLNVGLRVNYGFNDIEPDPTYYVLNDGVFMPDLISEKATHPVSLKLFLELNYYFAFWGDASCGQGRLMFFK